MENLFDHLFMLNIYCVGTGISTFISISDWSDPYIFRRKMEKTRSVKDEMEGKTFIPRQNWNISFVIIIIKVPFPTLYLYLECKQLCFRSGKGLNRRNESTKKQILIITLIISWLYWKTLAQKLVMTEPHQLDLFMKSPLPIGYDLKRGSVLFLFSCCPRSELVITLQRLVRMMRSLS